MNYRDQAADQLNIGNHRYHFYNLHSLAQQYNLERLPYCLKILLENLLRNEDGKNVTQADIDALCQWQADAEPTHQVNFSPARVVLQDFTGVPAVVDLAAMRDAMSQLGGDPAKINPRSQVDLVIDHSVMVDYYGDADSLKRNTDKEFERNGERYQFLRWGQQAFDNFRVVPPGTGIVHQVNLEYLASVVMTEERDGETWALPDTLVGTDSHTTMINGLGVLGWGVGGIEAEAAMLGQPITMLIPEVVGFKLQGQLPEGATATDLVLTVTEILRKKGVVGKFVEFYGDGLDSLPLADRATIANMAPEYGATCGIFPIDQETLNYLELSGRSETQRALVEAYAKAQGLWRESGAVEADYSATLSLDLNKIEPSLAGPKRPQDRVPLSMVTEQFNASLHQHLNTIGTDKPNAELRFEGEGGQTAPAGKHLHDQGAVDYEIDGHLQKLRHGAVVIAAITSCTNTSNPAVMLAAGLVARKARAYGLNVKPWVKTSLAPGSQVVPAYLRKAGVLEPLEQLGFNIVGFGCTTCIGNSGPLHPSISNAIRSGKLQVASVLSGNRNFEGRIHQDVPSNFLASPPLVVAYALAGTLAIDLSKDALGEDAEGKSVYLKDLWPSQKEIAEAVHQAVTANLYREQYADVFSGTDAWRALPSPEDKIYSWPDSSYVKQPPYFEGMSLQPDDAVAVQQARCLVKVGDSITTDHISPAGAIKPDSPAGIYLQQQGVSPDDFNSYGSRRGNHEVMLRGTFANVRLRNQLAAGTEGSWTTHFPSGDVISIYDASQRYLENKTPLVVLAGKEYGTGSSRDWAAKGTYLLGVKAVLAESYERIHRSNLVGFGILPLQFEAGDSAGSLGLSGDEVFDIEAVKGEPRTLEVTATDAAGKVKRFYAEVRIDTAVEWDYFRHGGILHFVLRNLVG